MKPVVFALVGTLIAVLVGCANELKVTPAGPSVPDQLNSRGYITTPDDTIPPVDTTGLEFDTL